MRVLTVSDYPKHFLIQLLEQYGLDLHVHADAGSIKGSYWGGSEAGLVDNQLHVCQSTPLHSALHEACHYICMDSNRRDGLDTDAGGDYEEENGVCYLQILLANELPGVGSDRMTQDMDSWGYTFRLGSAGRWFAEDAEDALAWLRRYNLVNATGRPTFIVRSEPDIASVV